MRIWKEAVVAWGTIPASAWRDCEKLQETIFFLNLRIVGGGVQTGSTRHHGHLLSYCACPGLLWRWRIIRWNEDWQGKPKYSEKTCPSATLSTTNPTWPDPGSNPGRRGGKAATNRLSYVGAKLQETSHKAANVPVEIQTENFLNTRQEHYHYTNPLWFFISCDTAISLHFVCDTHPPCRREIILLFRYS
jgi:hypothetical protein